MASVATTRKYLSDVIKTRDADSFTFASARVLVKTLSGTKVIDPMGLALIWDNTISAFRELNSADTAPVAASSLPSTVGFCVAVGDGTGVGNALADVTLSTTGVSLDVIFRGGDDLAVIFEGINFSGTATNTEKTLFRTNLEKQGVQVQNRTSDVVHTYV